MNLFDLSRLIIVLLASGGWGMRSEAGESQPTNTITVVGFGETAATTDMAEVVFGVSSDGPSAAETVRQNIAKIDELKKRLIGTGINESSIRSTRFSISFDARSPVAAYRATQLVFVEIRVLAHLTELLDKVGPPATSHIEEIRYLPRREPQLVERTWRLAVDNARAKAAVLADAAAADLGSVIGIVELLPPDESGLQTESKVELAQGRMSMSQTERPLRMAVRVTYALRPRATR